LNSIKVLISSKYFSAIFYSTWILLALWQANYTDLLNDEAYYWKYSQFLDWGYFDHPPMVALLIKIGTSIFGGELGVRLLFVLLGTASIYLMELVIKPTNKFLFYIIISSIALVHFTSFLALPDVPLLFFTALFFFLIKKYLTNGSVVTALALGLTIACLLLSKYHAFVIIILALLANLQLLKKTSFYFIVLTALIAVIPHFLWQWHHDFPSIQYHFHDRNLAAYTFSNTLNYILIQIVLFGPFIGILLWLGFFKAKIKSQFERTLYWQVIGVLVFFFVLTFNGKIQGHWTSILLLPLTYFGYHFLHANAQFRKITFYQFPIALLLIIVARIAIATPVFNNSKIEPIFEDFKGKAKWAHAIQKTTQEKPVVFMNSYQNAAIYEFYTGVTAITISNVMSRKNQYDLWQYEDSLRGKTIVLLPNYFVDQLDTLPNVSPITQYTIIENFQHYGQIKLLAPDWQEKPPSTKELTIRLEILNSNHFTFRENPYFPSVITYTFFRENHFISQHRTDVKLSEMTDKAVEIKMTPPSEKGIYQVYFSIQTGWLPPSLNSAVYLLKIND
jgi:hypothetical protein